MKIIAKNVCTITKKREFAKMINITRILMRLIAY